ncbi:MAG: ATP-binding cassette domain-containing protein, partial [Bdellovibrionota bacterium]
MILDASKGEIILRAEGLRKIFKKGKTEIPVLRGVDLTIHRGEMMAVTGASGVGKSTLLHILGTLEAPTSGKVFFGQTQQNVFQYSEKALSHFRNKALGFVFQFHYLL